MEFWNLINKGLEYYEKKMFDCACKYFNQAKKLRKDGAYLTEIIHLTKNFNSMFMCDNGENSYVIFDAYFNTINMTIKLYNEKNLGEDIYKYILTRMLDLKAMFLKSIKYHISILSETNLNFQKIVKLYSNFKEYLQEYKQKIIDEYINFNEVIDIKLTKEDIEELASWCDIIILNNFELYNDDNAIKG